MAATSRSTRDNQSSDKRARHTVCSKADAEEGGVSTLASDRAGEAETFGRMSMDIDEEEEEEEEEGNGEAASEASGVAAGDGRLYRSLVVCRCGDNDVERSCKEW